MFAKTLVAKQLCFGNLYQPIYTNIHIQRCLFVKHCQSPGTSLSHYSIHHLQSWYGRSVRAHRSVNTGRLVWTSTEMLFPCTRGLSLMKFSTSGPKGRLCLQCKIDCVDDRQIDLGYQRIGTCMICCFQFFTIEASTLTVLAVATMAIV